MVGVSELVTQKENLEEQLRFCMHEGDVLQGKLDAAKTDQSLPPYVITSLENDRRLLAAQILKLHSQIDSITKDIIDLTG
jgi:hypothetical protein